MISIVGYIAAAMTTIAFIPQAIKVIKTKDTESLSLIMYIILTFGLMLWLYYGYLINDYALIFANLITGSMSLLILIYKIRIDVLKRKGN